jgi:hypothetical protein
MRMTRCSSYDGKDAATAILDAVGAGIPVLGFDTFGMSDRYCNMAAIGGLPAAAS